MTQISCRTTSIHYGPKQSSQPWVNTRSETRKHDLKRACVLLYLTNKGETLTGVISQPADICRHYQQVWVCKNSHWEEVPAIKWEKKKNGMMWTFDVLSTKGNMPDSEGMAGSRGSLFKTLLDRDQYVTGLKNSSHWPWHLFWDGRRCVANTEERSSEATGSFHCSHPYLSFKRAIFLFFFKSNSWVFTGGWDQTITCVHAAFIPAKAN